MNDASLQVPSVQVSSVQVRELAAWGFDPYAYRPPGMNAIAADALKQHLAHMPKHAIAAPEWDWLREKLTPHGRRSDLLAEMHGLEWSLEVIDLRLLLSFQRRLHFDSRWNQEAPPVIQDGAALIELCFSKPQIPVYSTERIDSQTLLLRSSNPNLQVHFAEQPPFVAVSCGSSFLEVAEFRGRWFLRDGYHRAYHLLRQGVVIVPAVLVRARCLEELGATKPWFFAEATLFSERPPQLIDFLDDNLNVTYTRPALSKNLSITVQESYAVQESQNPASGPGVQS